MQRCTRKPKTLVVHALVLLWAFYFCVGFTFHYHPDYVHAHADELQPHDHTGHFHSHEVEGFAAVINPDASPVLPGETHHHTESMPGSDSETLQLNFNKNSLPPLKFKVVVHSAIISVASQDSPRIAWHAMQQNVPLNPALHSPLAASGRAPPALLS
ncbi:hypothetical protein [Nitrospina watsonii]|nr:hypothetical protein [Nitrospina watsonii]